jgi:cytochrome c biogenesis protein ResB
MNEPLKHNGFTFYQASFQENQTGEATTSILSVNKDPGRWIKYLGSFLIVLGTIVMFYFKHYRLKIFSKVSTTPE